jgi:hypothetical protein
MVEKLGLQRGQGIREFIFRDWSAFPNVKTAGSVNSGTKDKWIKNKMYLASNTRIGERSLVQWVGGKVILDLVMSNCALSRSHQI